ncbi:MAG: DUF1566 domain-containing protein [Pseudomonadales bacterium]|nr:DUF1566 domain-containing protein [Pseudomonadales bacterium]
MRKTYLASLSVLAIAITGCETNLTKIDEAGVELASTATEWSCVADTDSSLMWEKKTEYGKRWWNAWYTNTTNPANTPTSARGTCLWDNGEWVEDESCHTEGYVDYINDLALCGYDDWRVPTEEEFLTILDPDRSSPFFNVAYFPYEDMVNVWTATDSTYATSGDGRAIRYYLLHTISPVSQERGVAFAVQLVRDN